MTAGARRPEAMLERTDTARARATRFPGALLQAHFLVVLVVLAFVVRVPAAAVIARVVDPSGASFLAMPDARGYDQVSWQQAQYWHGAGPPVNPGDQYLLNVYTYTEAAIYFVIGHQPLAMILLNCACAALTAGLTYLMGRLLFGPLAAGFSGLATAFFPSTFVWSVVNLKDAMFVFFVALYLWLLTRLVLTARWRLIAPALVALALVGGLRLYVQPLLSLTLAGAVAVQRRARFSRKWRVFAALVCGCALVLWLSGATTYLGISPARLNAQRFYAAAGAQSAFVPATTAAPAATDASTADDAPTLATGRSLRELAAWLPHGFAYAVAAPFPWAARRTAERLTIPEMLVWYLAVALAVLGVAVHWRDWPRYAHLLAYLAGMLLIQSVAQGNLGTLVRQRGMLIPFTLIFSGAGAAWLWSWWRHRRERAG